MWKGFSPFHLTQLRPIAGGRRSPRPPPTSDYQNFGWRSSLPRPRSSCFLMIVSHSVAFVFWSLITYRGPIVFRFHPQQSRHVERISACLFSCPSAFSVKLRSQKDRRKICHHFILVFYDLKCISCSQYIHLHTHTHT